MIIKFINSNYKLNDEIGLEDILNEYKEFFLKDTLTLNEINLLKKSIINDKINNNVYKSIKEVDGTVFKKKYYIESLGVSGELLMENVKHPNLMEFISYYKEKEVNPLTLQDDHFITFYYRYYDRSNWIDLIDIYNQSGPIKDLISDIYNNRKEISFQLVKVVNFLHSQNIVHRDIKLDNILYNTHEKKIILCDFEYCKKIKNNMTKKILIGTPLYYPPEMLNKSLKQIDYKKVDVWNVGFTIYVIFFNKIPKANEIFWNKDINLNFSSSVVKQLFTSTLNLYPRERKSLDQIIQLEYFK